MTLLAASALAVAAPLSAAAVEVPIPTIPYTRFVLPNGLTVVVSEDHKAPAVAVGVWYHVGSAQEPSGKTGFAHLFEHLMFQGSENYQDEFFKPFEQVGAADQNGTASPLSHHLFRDRADHRLGHGAMDGVGSHGAFVGRHRPSAVGRATRRGAERKAPGRQKPIRALDLGEVKVIDVDGTAS